MSIKLNTNAKLSIEKRKKKKHKYKCEQKKSQFSEYFLSSVFLNYTSLRNNEICYLFYVCNWFIWAQIPALKINEDSSPLMQILVQS